ncbi:MAG: FIST C-terminal domain-containing protein, partial [Alphaproteobacteria bacterium]
RVRQADAQVGIAGASLLPNLGASLGGEAHVVTEAMANLVIALDGKPALEVLKGDVGEILSRNLRRIAGYIHAGLMVGGSDGNDYRVRSLIGLDMLRGWLAIGGDVAAGDRMVFVRRDANSAQSDLRRMVREVRARADRPPRGGLYYSCVGRGPHMFGTPGGEMSLIREELGDIPMTGFYANGEICNDRLYGYTGVLTLFL